MKIKKSDKNRLMEIHKQVTQALSFFEDLVEEKNDYLDSRSDRWRESDKGYDFECAVDTLEGIHSNLESVTEQLDDFIENHMKTKDK